MCFYIRTCLPELLSEQVALQQQQLKMQQMLHTQMQETHNLTQMLHENLSGHIQSQDNETQESALQTPGHTTPGQTTPTVDNNQTQQLPPPAGSGSLAGEYIPIGTAAKAEHEVSFWCFRRTWLNCDGF